MRQLLAGIGRSKRGEEAEKGVVKDELGDAYAG